MKKLLGFGFVHIARCQQCGALFSLDMENDIEITNINNDTENLEKVILIDCPNCGEYVHDITMISADSDNKAYTF